MLNELRSKAERQLAGLSNLFEDHAKTPLAEHLADFKQHHESKGITAKHVRTTLTRLRSALDGCRICIPTVWRRG